jgi:hypothetical protein
VCCPSRAGIQVVLHELLKISSVVRSATPDSLRLILHQKGVGLRRNASGDLTACNSSLPRPVESRRCLTAANDYLVGTQLDEALAAGQDILISRLFADGDVRLDAGRGHMVCPFLLRRPPVSTIFQEIRDFQQAPA